MHRALLAGAFAAFFSACGVDDFEEVITDEATLPKMQPAGTPLNATYGGTFNSLNLSQARSFQNEGVSPDDVDAIFVKSIKLEMDSGSNNPTIDRLNLYVQSMTIWVEAPGEERKTLARLDPTPADRAADLTVEADFAPSAADAQGTGLKPYAVAESMKIGADLVLTENGSGTFLTIKVKTTVTLLIDINLLGI
jgi:hypothetical protein